VNPEGEISVRLECADARVRSINVTSSRTGLPPRLVRGKPAPDVQRLVPLLFSICNRAQGAAAAAAMEAAQGTPASFNDSVRRTLEVMLETLQETVWRLLIDWPKAMGETPLVPAVAAVRHACNTVVDDGVTLDSMLAVAESALVEHVYGVPPEAWVAATNVNVLDKWIERGPTMPARLLRRLRDESPALGRSDAALMPDATFENLSRCLLGEMEVDPEYTRYPRWAGLPAETGALARQVAVPLVAALLERDGRTAATRFVARLVELAVLMRDLRLRSGGRIAPVRGHALGASTGIGLAETARGLLLHRVRVEAGLVTDYRIVAPTEWNFHPGGPLAQGLQGRPAADRARLEREARTVVQSLDPCVACRVEIVGA
jgi:Ni,Fe-hydrogenase I large subunit